MSTKHFNLYRPELDDTPSNDKSQPQKKVKGSSTRIEAGVLHTPADLSNSSLQRTLNSSVHDTDEFHDKYRYLNRERDEFNMLKRLISKESSGERPPQELHEILSLVKEADRFSITANNLYKHIKKRRKFNGYASADAGKQFLFTALQPYSISSTYKLTNQTGKRITND